MVIEGTAVRPARRMHGYDIAHEVGYDMIYFMIHFGLEQPLCKGEEWRGVSVAMMVQPVEVGTSAGLAPTTARGKITENKKRKWRAYVWQRRQ